MSIRLGDEDQKEEKDENEKTLQDKAKQALKYVLMFTFPTSRAATMVGGLLKSAFKK